MKNRFERYIGIDYSGASIPDKGLPNIRVYELNAKSSEPKEVLYSDKPRQNWSRKSLAYWLLKILSEDCPTVVGIDHGFSFPSEYFEKYKIEKNWYKFLDDFHAHWPTDQDGIKVDDIRKTISVKVSERSGENNWKRIAEKYAGSAKSVFHFDVTGQVAKSTHAGIPWLIFLKKHLGKRIHFWPFDGWAVPVGSSVIAEVYPSIWREAEQLKSMTSDQYDAFIIAKNLYLSDKEDGLSNFFNPHLTTAEKLTASYEGWILGVNKKTIELRLSHKKNKNNHKRQSENNFNLSKSQNEIEVYHSLYCQLKQAHANMPNVFPDHECNRILTSIMAGKSFSWRVIGITRKALEEFEKFDFKYKAKMGITRAHLIPRISTVRKLLDQNISFTAEEFFKFWLDNDKTVLCSKGENKAVLPEYIPIENDNGQLFSCSGKLAGWHHKAGERTFLKELLMKLRES